MCATVICYGFKNMCNHIIHGLFKGWLEFIINLSCNCVHLSYVIIWFGIINTMIISMCWLWVVKLYINISCFIWHLEFEILYWVMDLEFFWTWGFVSLLIRYSTFIWSAFSTLRIWAPQLGNPWRFKLWVSWFQ